MPLSATLSANCTLCLNQSKVCIFAKCRHKYSLTAIVERAAVLKQRANTEFQTGNLRRAIEVGLHFLSSRAAPDLGHA